MDFDDDDRESLDKLDPAYIASQKASFKNEIDPIIVKRFNKTDAFYLILNGKVSICSGREGFMIEKGIFNYIGE